MIELQHLTKRFATQGGTVVALNDKMCIRDSLIGNAGIIFNVLDGRFGLVVVGQSQQHTAQRLAVDLSLIHILKLREGSA